MLQTCLFIIVLFVCVDNCPTKCDKNKHDFIDGLFHGSVLYYIYLKSLIYKDVVTYSQNNKGLSYLIGFLLGLIICFMDL